MINPAFSKAMESVRKQRIIKLGNNDKGRKCLVSKTNHFSTKWFPEKLIATEIRKTQIKINNLVYLVLWNPDLSTSFRYKLCLT